MSLLPDFLDTKERSEAGVVFPILRLSDGAPALNGDVPITVTVRGPDSAAFLAASRELDVRRLNNAAAEQHLTDVEKMQRRDDEELELLARMVISWTGFIDQKTQVDAPCTFDNICEVFRGFPVVRAQIALRATNRVNFTKDSASGS